MSGARQASTGAAGTISDRRRSAGQAGDGASARAVPAVTRGVSILKLLARSHEPLGVIAIARALDIIPSTALHILRVLVAEQLVAFDPETKRYSLDAGILTIARSALRQDNFSGFAQPHLDTIAATYGVTAIGTRVLGLSHMIVVAISHSEMMLRLHVDVGSRYPALISATGRCLAAFGNLPEADVKRAFERLRWDNPPDYARWTREVALARRLGYGVDDGSYIRGITIVAAPVFGIDGRMTHALAIVAVRDQAPDERIAAIGRDTRAAALAISERLGFAGPAPSADAGRGNDQAKPTERRAAKRHNGSGNAGKRRSTPA